MFKCATSNKVMSGLSSFCFMVIFSSLVLGQVDEPQQFPTASDGVSLIINQIDVQSTGAMHWGLAIWNQTESPFLLDLLLDQTYLADELGNRYAVIDTSYKAPIIIEPYVRLNFSINFSPPEDTTGEVCGLKKFKVTLTHNRSNGSTTYLAYRGENINMSHIVFNSFDFPLNLNCAQ
jgi:hypothetical protein